jgi:ferredoxin
MKEGKPRTLVKASTRAFYREGRRAPGYSLSNWLHGYVYGRWLYLYIRIGAGKHPLSRAYQRLSHWVGRALPGRNGDRPQPEAVQLSEEVTIQPSGTFADGYHGKVLPLRSAVQLVSVNEEIKITNLEKVIPYVRARDLILQNPEHILALECPCRAARENPCLPLDVCLIVGEPFASFVEEHHPRRSRRISPEEAADILRAEDARGHVHHAFFKDAMLGRFYAICNCCPCCCGALQAHRRGTPMLASSGYLCRVDELLCIACGECQEHCPFEALSVEDNTAVVEATKCMGCGICVAQCHQGALSLERAVEKGEPLEIFALLEKATA